MVALGGGMHGIRRDTEIRSMSGRYASYWNAFLFVKLEVTTVGKKLCWVSPHEEIQRLHGRDHSVKYQR